MRKKLVTPALGLTAAIAALAILVPLVPTQQSTAQPPPPCVGNFLTAERWGHGDDCGEASQDLFNQVWALAEQRCGVNNVCNWSLVITGGCPGSGGSIMMDGQLQHGCFESELF